MTHLFTLADTNPLLFWIQAATSIWTRTTHMNTILNPDIYTGLLWIWTILLNTIPYLSWTQTLTCCEYNSFPHIYELMLLTNTSLICHEYKHWLTTTNPHLFNKYAPLPLMNPIFCHECIPLSVVNMISHHFMNAYPYLLWIWSLDVLINTTLSLTNWHSCPCYKYGLLLLLQIWFLTHEYNPQSFYIYNYLSHKPSLTSH